MAKLQYAIATAVVLLASFSSSSSSLAPELGPTSTASDDVDLGPTADFALSPSDLLNLQAIVKALETCGAKLGQGGATQCLAAISGVTEGVVPDEQCCKNVLALDGDDKACWDVLFPKNKEQLVPLLVGYCHEATLASPPVLPRKGLGLGF